MTDLNELTPLATTTEIFAFFPIYLVQVMEQQSMTFCLILDQNSGPKLACIVVFIL